MNGGSSTEETALIDGIKNKPVNLDRVFTSLFTTAQSLFYITLEYNISSEIMPAASALSAASGCGPAAVFVGGMALYDSAKSLVDTINYRAEMLDNFYNYCVGDQEGQADATIAMVELVFKMAKNLYDKALGAFEEEKDIMEQVEDGINTLLEDLYDVICGGDEEE